MVGALLIGCGRFGFDSRGEADAAPVRDTWTFGEVPGATVGGVTSDTFMCDGASEATLNWGAFYRFDGGPSCTGLLRFDLSAVPAGAVVVEASVALWPELVPSVEGQVDVHRVTEAWVEGTLQGDPGEANYDQRAPGIDWTTRGARPPGSSEATPLHAFHPAVFEAQRIPLPPVVVQGWVDDPASNHGVAFFGSDEYGGTDDAHPHLLSSESPVASQRPLLTLTFEVR